MIVEHGAVRPAYHACQGRIGYGEVEMELLQDLSSRSDNLFFITGWLRFRESCGCFLN